VNGSQTALILGAGASRGVKYAHAGECPSPLDADFFDLLQRLSPKSPPDHDDQAVAFVLERLRSLPYEFRRSMERTFFTLHLRAYLSKKLAEEQPADTDQAIMAQFARAIQKLLRTAHGKRVCEYHRRLFELLAGGDVIVSFNYDLVAERALRPVAEARNIAFASAIYGLDPLPPQMDIPLLFKLHGSSNWNVHNGNLRVRTKEWRDFDRTPGYRGYEGQKYAFPIFLPFWDKRIEQAPWLSLWKNAFHQLQRAAQVIVWGYSLPPTDIKAQQVFALALGGRKIRLCVIDPSVATRERWRSLFPEAQYWEYNSIPDFLGFPPPWAAPGGIPGGRGDHPPPLARRPVSSRQPMPPRAAGG